MPLGKLKKLGSKLDIAIASSGEKTINIKELGTEADLMAMQSPGNQDGAELIWMYRKLGRKVVVDYDDYSFDLSPGNPRYAELGTRECEILGADGQVAFRWRDGENGFDLKNNIAKYEAFLRCLEGADLVTTTTEHLAEKFRKYARKVVICPNSIDFDLWKPIPRPREYDGQVRIGWFGGDSHLEDLVMFKDLLPKLCKKYPQVKIVMQASPVPQWKSIFADVPSAQIEWYTWADLKFYTLFLASRHWDIGLVPLAPNEFNFCKSGIKHFEFAALKVPTICQNSLPYAPVVEHGKTGLLADGPEEWYEHACRLIENAALRRDIGGAAYRDVRAKWSLESNCRAWERAYMDCLGGR